MSPCGAEAANLSLNIIEGETVAGAEIFGAGCGSVANTSLKAGRPGRAATMVEFFTTGASNAALLTDG